MSSATALHTTLMNAATALALCLDPGLVLHAQGMPPDPWQRDLLLAQEQFLLLNCSRQSGKSTTVAALAVHQLLTAPGSLVLLVAPAERQSHELFRKVLAAYHALHRPIAAAKLNQSEMELANGSRVVALPGREDTIRSFSGVNLLIIDEAARVPDDLYRSVRPMLAVSQGRLLALSTPFGMRGWFHDEWQGSGPWRKVHIPWHKCPRIAQDFIAEESRALGQAWVDQEYNALFTALEGLVFPDLEKCLLKPQDEYASPGDQVGGIDFGWRNPFAAIWGTLDRDDVLWLTGERYLRETPISDHAVALPANVTWYADPAGRTEIEELRRAGLVVRKGDNSLRRGIALVTARLRTGRLKIDAKACPNLLAESRLYRYPTAAERQLLGENPIDAHNHALAALRYLVTRIEPPSKANTVPTPQDEQSESRGLHPDDDDSLWLDLH